MNYSQQRLRELFQKQLDASINAAEQQELFALCNEAEQEPLLQQLFDDAWKDLEESRPQKAIVRPLVKRGWFKISAAAAVVATIAGIWLWTSVQKQSSNNQPVVAVHTNQSSGIDGAVLTMENGKQILLDTVKSGSIIQVNGTTMEVKNGQLLYLQTNTDAITWHTMSTPKGRQFQLQLPDGSQLWLNAASTIRYPSAFSGHERKVEIEGEAYLEIAKDKNKPFIVVTRYQQLEVLGTRFNVNAYADEAREHTTLIDGSVKVSDKNAIHFSILQPKQQATITENSVTVQNAGIDEVMAWKNGYFQFAGADIPTVMRQLQRWYDIEVSYEGPIPAREFHGKMQRDLSLSEIISLLQKAEVHVKQIEGKKLLVTP